VIEASILSKLLREREVASANLFLVLQPLRKLEVTETAGKWKRFIEEEAKKEFELL